MKHNFAHRQYVIAQCGTKYVNEDAVILAVYKGGVRNSLETYAMSLENARALHTELTRALMQCEKERRELGLD